MADKNSLINYGNLSTYHAKTTELLDEIRGQISELIERLKALEAAAIEIVEADSTE
jgi:hypothetical protein